MADGPTQKIWRNGHLVDWADGTVHVMSHGLHYGSSVFEGIRCYETPRGGAIFRLRDHIERLHDSARIYRMDLPYSVDTLCQASLDTVAANDMKACYLRPLVVRTGEQMGIDPTGVPVETFVIAWKWGAYLGHAALSHGVDVGVSSWRRAAPDTFPALAKAGGNYLNSQLAKLEAKANGYAEALMLDSFGFVAEGSGQNLFVVRDRVVYTAPLSSAILDGITRDSVMTIARDLGFEVREMQMPREFLYTVDECFFTGTASELTPIRSIDRIPVGKGGVGDVTRAIQERYLGIANGTVDDMHGWLTHVPTSAAVGATVAA